MRLLAINADVAIQRSVALAIERAGVELRGEPLRREPPSDRCRAAVALGRRGLVTVELGELFQSLRVQPPAKAT